MTVGRWREINTNLGAFAGPRPSDTTVVVLKPRPGRQRCPPSWTAPANWLDLNLG
ncbi:hypothetical protein ACGFIE_31775 [Micromonospora sp. NPDC049275]|uniref:hypothetical protein n=1 Tax=Micromonospora sp. NPDC049275 TaxID=3364268 RepID=UPI003713C493